MRYKHITVHISDMGKSLSFYHGLLGLNILHRGPAGKGGELAFLGEAGQPSIELIAIPDEEPTYAGFSIGFEVPSLKDATLKMEQAGHPIIRGPISPNPKVTFSFFHDPDGIEIQLLEQKA